MSFVPTTECHTMSQFIRADTASDSMNPEEEAVEDEEAARVEEVNLHCAINNLHYEPIQGKEIGFNRFLFKLSHSIR